MRKPLILCAILLCIFLLSAFGLTVRAQPFAPGPLVLIGERSYVFPRQPASAPAAAAAAPMREQFEGAWPAAGWQLSPGSYTWGKRSCHPHSGQFAGWSVGGGPDGSSLPCSGSYPNGSNAWAMYGPFDLASATSAQLSFFVWGKTQVDAHCSSDQFVALSSQDGAHFSGLTGCGDFRNGPDGNGYNRMTLDLADRIGQRQVWILFGLLADGTTNDIGITVDDIALDLDSIAPPPPTATTMPTSTPQPTSTPRPTATPSNAPAPVDGQYHLFLPLVLGYTPPSPPPTPTQTPPSGGSSYDGNWSGSTTAGAPISFSVANRALTTLNYEYTIQGCGMEVRTQFGKPLAINGNTFTFHTTMQKTYPLPPFSFYTVDILIQGTFNSTNGATGSMQVNDGLCGKLNTTWSAQK